jgi:hypothetical protein
VRERKEKRSGDAPPRLTQCSTAHRVAVIHVASWISASAQSVRKKRAVKCGVPEPVLDLQSPHRRRLRRCPAVPRSERVLITACTRQLLCSPLTASSSLWSASLDQSAGKNRKVERDNTSPPDSVLDRQLRCRCCRAPRNELPLACICKSLSSLLLSSSSFSSPLDAYDTDTHQNEESGRDSRCRVSERMQRRGGRG